MTNSENLLQIDHTNDNYDRRRRNAFTTNKYNIKIVVFLFIIIFLILFGTYLAICHYRKNDEHYIFKEKENVGSLLESIATYGIYPFPMIVNMTLIHITHLKKYSKTFDFGCIFVKEMFCDSSIITSYETSINNTNTSYLYIQWLGDFNAYFLNDMDMNYNKICNNEDDNVTITYCIWLKKWAILCQNEKSLQTSLLILTHNGIEHFFYYNIDKVFLDETKAIDKHFQVETLKYLKEINDKVILLYFVISDGFACMRTSC
jgi:nitrogen regulatory protein PII-like uncharacterized protein